VTFIPNAGSQQQDGKKRIDGPPPQPTLPAYDIFSIAIVTPRNDHGDLSRQSTPNDINGLSEK
jgi:hypothetical protein